MTEREPKFTGPESHERLERKEGKEMGREVLLIVKLIRHGERTKTGELTDYGRTVTKQKAAESGLPEISGGKAVGSPFKPKESTKPPRSLETADIYVEELLRTGKIQKKYATRAREILSPEGLKTKEPFDWIEFYNSNLPANFEGLSDEEKAKAAHIAQTATVEKILNMEEAAEFNREVAGSFASFLDTYFRMVERLKNGSKILYVAGTHGGMMEPFLKECLVRKDKEGRVSQDFQHLEEIGGAFRPSESFNVVIETDEEGQKRVRVNFDDPNRLPEEELTLDLEKLRDLKDEYDEKHQRKTKHEMAKKRTSFLGHSF